MVLQTCLSPSLAVNTNSRPCVRYFAEPHVCFTYLWTVLSQEWLALLHKWETKTSKTSWHSSLPKGFRAGVPVHEPRFTGVTHSRFLSVTGYWNNARLKCILNAIFLVCVAGAGGRGRGATQVCQSSFRIYSTTLDTTTATPFHLVHILHRLHHVLFCISCLVPSQDGKQGQEGALHTLTPAGGTTLPCT